MNTNTMHYKHSSYTMKKSMKRAEGLSQGAILLLLLGIGYLLFVNLNTIVEAAYELSKAINL